MEMTSKPGQYVVLEAHPDPNRADIATDKDGYPEVFSDYSQAEDYAVSSPLRRPIIKPLSDVLL